MAEKWDFSKGEIYRLLEVADDASEKQIRSAYKQKALLFHPDKSSDTKSLQSFLLLTNAIGILTDPLQRSVYDEKLRRWKDRDKREAEMLEARRQMQQNLLKREQEAMAMRESQKKSFKFEESIEKGKTTEDTFIEVEICVLPNNRDELLDFLQQFGELRRFSQLSKDRFKLCYAKIASLTEFVHAIEADNRSTCTIVNLDTIKRLLQEHDRLQTFESPIAFNEFLVFERQVLAKLERLVKFHAK